jgi:uncharacterized membrane protein
MPAANREQDTSWAGFVKATIAGGLLFLLPSILVVLLFSHAMRFAGKVAHPISQYLTLDKVVGPAGEEFLAVLMLVFISVAAGFVARTAVGRNLMRWSENSFLGGLPQYRLVKSVAEGLAQIENAEDLKPVLVNIEDGWQIGYLLSMASMFGT